LDLQNRDDLLLAQSLVTLSILYYLPDHRNIVNEFVWQTTDVRPRFPRVHAFLDHWRREIDAIIKEVLLADLTLNERREVRYVNGIFRVH
jgi:uncharacterized protein Usg